MKKTIVSFFAFFCCFWCQAQINEIGIGFGGANYVGDVGSTQFIAPKDLGFNITYRWNRSPRHSYRVTYSQMKIRGDDLKSDMASRKKRGYAFSNNLKELTLGMEFNFFEFDLHELGYSLTPFVFTGISGIQYNDIYFRNNRLIEDKKNKKYSAAIPIIVGLKSRIGNQLVLSAEVGARYTFTNNLDGSMPKDPNTKRYQFGRKDSNDWYFYTGLTLTYTFGKNPCYCTP